MTALRTDEHGDPIYSCARHPEVETALQCGRCDTPICPRCMVHTPGGIRCPDCARLRRPPMYELAPLDYAKAFGVALVLAPALGFVGALLIPGRGFGGFFLILALFVGSGAGTLVAEALRRATSGKRGPVMQAAAAATLVGALLVRAVLGDALDAIFSDVAGLLIVAVGIFAAWGRLR
ncbi:MAG: hypothetical protein M0R73_03730 [Dehalococcoidia bacterium]|nr:hypothetical protein [Dehalococcoidia bacterium]